MFIIEYFRLFFIIIYEGTFISIIYRSKLKNGNKVMRKYFTEILS